MDFQGLRSRERKNALQRNKVKGISTNSSETTGEVFKVAKSAHQHSTTASASSEPCDTLLPSLTETLRLHPPSSLIDSVYYTKHFLKHDTCNEILNWLQTLPEYSRQSQLKSEDEESRACNGKWTKLRHAKRKVALFDASVAPLPPILSRLSQTLIAIDAFPNDDISNAQPNHVLINEYQRGMGIMPHTDGPAYHSRTATISIGGDVLFHLTKRPSNSDNQYKKDVMEVLLHGCGSLVVFANDAYLNHFHGIDETVEEMSSGVCANEVEGVEVNREYRVSLTFRCKK